VDNSTFAAEQNRTEQTLSLPVFFFFSQSTQAILRLIRTKGYILPDKRATISSSVLDWYPVLKRTDQTSPGIGGGERGGSTGIGCTGIGYFQLKELHTNLVLVLGLKAD
jgi:hypothetical protein